MRSMRVQVKDVKLFFDVEGTKLRPVGTRMQEVPTLLLLHGGPGFDHSEYKLGFSQLADIAQLIYLDHRGNGRSASGPTDGWNLASWADDVRAFCDVLEIDRPMVLGHSFGGIVAILYATRYPDHPAKLILASTSVEPVGERSYSMFERLGGRVAREAAVEFWTNPGKDTARKYNEICLPLYSQRRLPYGFYSRAIRNPEMLSVFIEHELAAIRIREHLGQIVCPTLVLAGEKDPITPVQDAQEIVAALPPDLVQFERFENAGHHLFWDQPTSFFDRVRRFMVS
jgi:pimeloyl-ACP methyl ester carboxylesterase